jgi:hypothetical protein
MKANEQSFCNKFHTPRAKFNSHLVQSSLVCEKAEVRYSKLKNGLADVDLKNEHYILGTETKNFLSDQY